MSGILSRSNTTKEVLFRFRTDIILRTFGDGASVREVALSEHYGTTRSAIRNALLVLEKEGLIRTQTNGTKVICSIEPEDIQNLYDLREHIEMTANRQFFSRMHKDFSPMMQVMNLITNVDGQDVAEILELDAEFHRSVIVCSNNKALLQAWETITGVMQSIFHLNMTQSEEYKKWFVQTFRDRHTRLFASLMVDPQESASQFAQHIADAREISEKAIAQMIKSRS
jgi:DNA-binding GntR family transcriptional regulator